MTALVGALIWVIPFRSYDYPVPSGLLEGRDRVPHVCTARDILVGNNIIKIDGRMHYIATPPESQE